MATPGFSGSVKASGTPVVITGEACTGLGGSVWQVTSAARRILDPATALVVKDGAATVSASLYSFDYLFGKVTFSGYTPSGAITINAAYLPLLALAEVKAWNLDMKVDLADVTTFDSAGVKQKLALLEEWSLNFDFLANPMVDLDGVAAGTQSLTTWRDNGTPKLIELKLSTTPHYWRGWGLFDTGSFKASQADVNAFNASMQSAPQLAGASWSWGT